jgi:4'-phosphopantetheinyl transferase
MNLSSIIYYDVLPTISWKKYTTGLATFNEGANIWLINVSDHIHLLSEAAVILDEAEKERAEKYRKQEDKNRFILGRIVLRKLLAELLQCQPEEVPIVISKHKKPVLASTSAAPIHFSLSHSGDYILIGISKNEIGVDIEHTDTAFEYKNVMQHSFNTEEISFINDDESQASFNFYLLWTRKEALLKATGKGLTNKLSLITAVDGKQEISQEVIDSTNNYTISSVSINDKYIASICRLLNSGEVAFWGW